MLGQQWEYRDYKDRLVPPGSLRAQLRLEEHEEEERQCLVLHVAAALLWQGEKKPSREAVHELAR